MASASPSSSPAAVEPIRSAETSVRAAICSPLAQAPPRGMWVWASQFSIIWAASILPAVAKRWTTRVKASG